MLHLQPSHLTQEPFYTGCLVCDPQLKRSCRRAGACPTEAGAAAEEAEGQEGVQGRGREGGQQGGGGGGGRNTAAAAAVRNALANARGSGGGQAGGRGGGVAAAAAAQGGYVGAYGSAADYETMTVGPVEEGQGRSGKAGGQGRTMMRTGEAEAAGGGRGAGAGEGPGQLVPAAGAGGRRRAGGAGGSGGMQQPPTFSYGAIAKIGDFGVLNVLRRLGVPLVPQDTLAQALNKPVSNAGAVVARGAGGAPFRFFRKMAVGASLRDFSVDAGSHGHLREAGHAMLPTHGTNLMQLGQR